MCRIFGISSKEEVELNEYLREFYKGSVEHPHGWGLAIMDDWDANLEKEPIQATKSYYLKTRLRPKITAKNAFAHIRYATVGNIDYHNCHPYSRRDARGRRWTQVHNGTIFDFEKLRPYFDLQEGDTDSERVLLYIMDQINAHPEIEEDHHARFELMNEIVCEMSAGNKLNLIIFDGEYTYVHTNFAGSLHYLREKNRVTISTVPLDHKKWEPVPMTQLLVFKEGNLIYEGTNHGNVYVETEENLKYLYRNFANL